MGAVAAITSLQTNLTVALATALVASASELTLGRLRHRRALGISTGTGDLRLGRAARGACGDNIGAGQKQRALRIALVGGAIVFAISQTLGLIAALWPQAWLALFSSDPRVIETGSAYLRIVGPTYGFFGLGMALYFASQGAAAPFMASVDWIPPRHSRDRRRLACASSNRLAQLAFRSARLRADRLRCRANDSDHIRRVVWSRAIHKCTR